MHAEFFGCNKLLSSSNTRYSNIIIHYLIEDLSTPELHSFLTSACRIKLPATFPGSSSRADDVLHYVYQVTLSIYHLYYIHHF